MRRLLALLCLIGLISSCDTAPSPKQGDAVHSHAAQDGQDTPDTGDAEAAQDPYAALDRFAEQLKATTEVARNAAASELPFGRGEGALHVLRLMRRAIDEELAWADTQHPYLQVQDERFAKLALGNPDNLYLVTRVDDDAIYRITGRRGTTADFTIQVYQGNQPLCRDPSHVQRPVFQDINKSCLKPSGSTIDWDNLLGLPFLSSRINARQQLIEHRLDAIAGGCGHALGLYAKGDKLLQQFW